jgi:hypothetical protein
MDLNVNVKHVLQMLESNVHEAVFSLTEKPLMVTLQGWNM